MDITVTRSLLLSCILLLSISSTALAISNVQLNDQFGKTHHTRSIFKDKPVIIIAGAQKKTSKHMPKWVKSLKKEVGNKATIYGMLNLSTLPFFVPHSAITNQLKETYPNTTMLCDHKGNTYKKLGFTKDALLEIHVYDAKGKHIKTVKGPYSPTRLKAVISSLP